MRRSNSMFLSSTAAAVVLMLATLVGGVSAGSATQSGAAQAAAPGAAANGTLCVVKFNDLDGDGKQGPNEPALSGWVFVVTDSNGNVVGTIGTAPGVPRCIDLPAGGYLVTETQQAGWTPTTTGGAMQPVIVTAGQTTTVTFGNHQAESGRICVVKFNDLDGDGKQGPNEPILFGWVFTIKDANGNVVGTITTTAAAPSCINVPAGTYTVTETVQPGWLPTTPGGATQTVVVVAGQTTTVTFGNHQVENGRICVVKFNDLDGDGKQGPNEPILFGWTFTIKDANGNVVGTITTVAGAINCINLPPGVYTVTETLQPGWTPTTPGGATQTVTVVSGQTTTVTFGNRQSDHGRICIVKFNDLDGDGKQGPNEPTLFGWVFTIKDANGNVVGTITTGDFAPNCIDLPPGIYTVTETPQPGWTPTTPGGLTQTVTVVAGQTTTVIFGNRQTESGRICIVKFNDLNGNGKQDPGEASLNGWVFSVLNSANVVVGTLVSGTDRNCITLPPGTYTVTETPISGWLPSTPAGTPSFSQTVVVVTGQTVIVAFGNHKPRIDHFECYTVAPTGINPPLSTVSLRDQFGIRTATVINRSRLCNPVRKNREPLINKDAHLVCYGLEKQPAVNRTVVITDQFGSDRLRVVAPTSLCLPTVKSLTLPFPNVKVGLDHFLCYSVKDLTPRSYAPVSLIDQFGSFSGVKVISVIALCNPVQKAFQGKVTKITNPTDHLVCYSISTPTFQPRTVFIKNQVEARQIVAVKPVQLCLPALKTVIQ